MTLCCPLVASYFTTVLHHELHVEGVIENRLLFSEELCVSAW